MRADLRRMQRGQDRVDANEDGSTGDGFPAHTGPGSHVEHGAAIGPRFHPGSRPQQQRSLRGDRVEVRAASHLRGASGIDGTGETAALAASKIAANQKGVVEGCVIVEPGRLGNRDATGFDRRQIENAHRRTCRRRDERKPGLRALAEAESGAGGHGSGASMDGSEVGQRLALRRQSHAARAAQPKPINRSLRSRLC